MGFVVSSFRGLIGEKNGREFTYILRGVGRGESRLKMFRGHSAAGLVWVAVLTR